MKLYVKSSSNSWPDKDFWESYRGREEDIYYPYKKYLEGPEREVAKKYNIDISFYGEYVVLDSITKVGYGYPFEVDALDWADAQITIAGRVNSQEEYKKEFEKFFKQRLYQGY